MKILMINVVCGIRSTGRICTDLAIALKKRGHTVKIAYGRESVPKEYERFAVRIGTDYDVRMHGIEARVLDRCGFGSKKTTQNFISWIREYNPDIIHLHNLHGYYINIEILFDYLRICKKKIIWTLHDCWAFTGHCSYFDLVKCEKWIEGCYNCPNINEYPKSIIDFSKRNWERKNKLLTCIPNLTIVTPSKWLADLVKKSFLRKYQVFVINNGIDVSKFYPLRNDFREYYGIQNKFIIFAEVDVYNKEDAISYYIELAKELEKNKACVTIIMIADKKLLMKNLPSNILALNTTNSFKEEEYIRSSANMIINHVECNVNDLATNICEEIKEKELDERLHIDISDIVTSSDGYWKSKKKLGLIGCKIIISVAAVWDKRKGLTDVIMIHDKVKAKVIIVGINDKKKRNVPKDIMAVMRTNNVEELRRLYGLADVFLNPTYEDNFPTTNIEALCCGTPVITYNTGGSAESIGKCGCAVKKGDTNALIKAIDNIKVTSQECKDQGLFFDKKLMTLKYLDLYRL